MKKTLLIALLLIPFLGISQTTKPIDGFLGIKFGSSMADVTASIKAKGGVLNSKNGEQPLIFTNVNLGHRPAKWLYVYFVDDKAYEGIIVFQAESEPESLDYYNALVKDVSDVYGPGKKNNSLKSPYEYGDGHEVLAISTGYGAIYDTWKDGKNTLQAILRGVQNQVYSQLLYVDGDLNAQAEAKEKAKEKSDF
jgi:hypothetical protein